jgi:hypothetical protein
MGHGLMAPVERSGWVLARLHGVTHGNPLALVENKSGREQVVLCLRLADCSVLHSPTSQLPAVEIGALECSDSSALRARSLNSSTRQ